MSRVIYTTERRPEPIAGVEYRNPVYFEKPYGNPDSVEVRGDFPHIVAAYGDKVKASETPSPPLDLTPEGIAKMAKSAVVELLEAHSATVDGRKGVATLRDELTAIMFIKEDDANE